MNHHYESSLYLPLEDPGGEPRLPSRNPRHLLSVLSGSVASHLIYADVWLHIPMTHRNGRYHHVHPSLADTADNDTVFYVDIVSPAVGAFTMALDFVVESNALDMCVDEAATHVHGTRGGSPL